MNINILLTGGRAPATLYLARLLNRNGYSVYVADSIPVYLCQYSKAVKKAFLIPSPQNKNNYLNSLINIIKTWHIDILIPTCEEIFYISKIKRKFPKKVHVLCDTFNKLELLHNKFSFFNFCKKNNINVPDSHLVQSRNEVMNFLEQNKNRKFVLKPIYSRFSDKTQFIFYGTEFYFQDEVKYILQEYIEGEEYCSYGICQKGNLKVYSDYQSIFTSGQGTSIAFQAIGDKNILVIMKTIIKILCLSGQIALDIIKGQDNKYYVIECNPRLTSGIQLITEDIFKKTNNLILPQKNTSSSIKLLLFLFRFKWFKKIHKWGNVVLKSNDVIFDIYDFKPFLGQFIVLIYYFTLAIKNKVSLKHITTLDIEWNGK